MILIKGCDLHQDENTELHDSPTQGYAFSADHFSATFNGPERGHNSLPDIKLSVTCQFKKLLSGKNSFHPKSLLLPVQTTSEIQTL